MRVTKEQLKQIIKEERARLEEQYRSGAMRAEQIVDMLTGKGEAHGDILMMLVKEIPDVLIPVLEKHAQAKGVNIRPLQEQASGMSSGQRRAIGDLSYQFEDEINSRMSSEDRNWYKNDDVLLAVFEMLDGLKETIQEYGKM